MVRCQNVLVNMVFFCLFFFFFFFFFFCKKKKTQKDVTSLSQHLIIIHSDQDLCPLTKLMYTIEYRNNTEKIQMMNRLI